MSKCGSMRQTAMFAVAEMREMLSHYDGISDEVVDEYAQLVMDYKRRHPEFQFTGDEYKTTNNTNKEDHAVEED